MVIRPHLAAGVTFPPWSTRTAGSQGRGEDASLRTDAGLFMSGTGNIKGSGSFSKRVGLGNIVCLGSRHAQYIKYLSKIQARSSRYKAYFRFGKD